MLELTVASAVFGLIAIILAVVLYFKQRRVRRPLFHIFTNQLVGDVGLPNLEIRYGGQNVERVSSTTVVFWNGGTSTIRRNDVAQTEPLRIEFPSDVQILDSEVIAWTRDEIMSDAKMQAESTTTLLLYFEFLEHGDGLSVRILHTGKARQECMVKGTVIEAPNLGKPQSVSNPRAPVSTRQRATAAVLVLATGAAWGLLEWLEPFETLSTGAIVSALAGLILGYVASLTELRLWRPYPIPRAIYPY